MKTRKEEITSIVFDFGSVLITWNPHPVLRPFVETDEDYDFLMSTVCSYDWARSIDKGLPFDIAVKNKIAEFPKYAKAITAFRERFLDMCPAEMPGMGKLLETLIEEGYKLYGLSNWDVETWPQIREKFNILEKIPNRVISGYVGHIKPEPEIYDILINKYNLDPSRTLFVDDNPVNVEGAKKIGFQTHIFRNAEELYSHIQTQQ